jgi:hypothetical protein
LKPENVVLSGAVAGWASLLLSQPPTATAAAVITPTKKPMEIPAEYPGPE